MSAVLAGLAVLAAAAIMLALAASMFARAAAETITHDIWIPADHYPQQRQL